MLTKGPEAVPQPPHKAADSPFPAGAREVSRATGSAQGASVAFADRPRQLLGVLCRATRASWGALALLSPDGSFEELLTHDPSGTVSRPAAAEYLRDVVEYPDATTAGREGPPRLGLLFAGPHRQQGVLCLVRDVADPAFTAAEVEDARSLCGWLADREMLEETRLRRQLKLLNHIAETAAGSVDLPRLLQAALTGLDRELPLFPGAVWLLEQPDAPAPIVAANSDRILKTRSSVIKLKPTVEAIDPSATLVLAQLTPGAVAHAPLAPNTRVPVSELPFADYLQSGEPFYAELDDPRDARSILTLGAAGAKFCLVMPLRAGEKIVGVLHCLCNRPAGFPPEFVQFLYLVADLLGAAVSNCQMFARLRTAYDALREAQGRLVHTEKMRALAEMAAGMAHEFNNALCGALGFLELALNEPGLSPSVRRHLESSRTSALDAAQTVRRVQSFARAHPSSEDMAAVDLDALVREAADLIRHKASSLDRARGAAIAIDVRSSDCQRVLGNTTELREVLLNLAFNAVDAMPAGGTLTVRTWSDRQSTFLAVSDTGVGIPEPTRARIFEPFFTTKGERGNGLGLSVVFGIVERHRGEIRVESEVGRGSTFTVRLPVLTRSSDPPAPTETSRFVRARRSLGVLVVEDEEQIGRFLQVALTNLGHRPRLVGSAERALEVLAAEAPFDVVLTDLGLPGMNGEELAGAIARQSPAIPVVLLSGWGGHLQAENHQREGIARVLGKPVTLSTLAVTLSEVCPS
jgi:signal transduction histidine kinase/CheY-like chemotaxis protein